MTILIAGVTTVCWFFIGILRLRYLDVNKDGDWLIMLTDSKNTNYPSLTSRISLFVICLLWPVCLIKGIRVGMYTFKFFWYLGL